jgi:hypothetical protein
MSLVSNLDEYRRIRDAEKRAQPVIVRKLFDPECANRTHYLIMAESADAVQTQIFALMAEAESFGQGYASFRNVSHYMGVYFSTGDVVVRDIDGNGV